MARLSSHVHEASLHEASARPERAGPRAPPPRAAPKPRAGARSTEPGGVICWGRTRRGERCRNPARVLFCRYHSLQPWVVLVVVGLLAGLRQDLVLPICSRLAPSFDRASKKPTSTIGSICSFVFPEHPSSATAGSAR